LVLGWLGGETSVDDLIARKKYARAIQLLNEQFKQGHRQPRLRLRMADVLILAGRQREAVPLLRGLADEFAVDGFAAKAIAVLKKAQRIEPRADVERKLATLIKQQRERNEPEPGTMVPGQLAGFEIGMEEFAPLAGAPALEPPRPAPLPEPVIEEIGVEPIGDEPPAAASEADAEGADAESIGDELIGALEEMLSQAAAAPAAPPPEGAPESPLFRHFSAEELAAVIGGLELIAYDPGDIIISQGEPGSSLFVLTSGVAKAFVRDERGRNTLARQMEEGSFFGEISILSGKPRTATVTAATRCELLELDRPRLDEITAKHPRVLEVLRQFYEERITRT
jgi:hypothetical protein